MNDPIAQAFIPPEVQVIIDKANKKDSAKLPARLLLEGIADKEKVVALRALDAIAFVFYCISGLIVVEGLYALSLKIIEQIKIGMSIRGEELKPRVVKFKNGLQETARAAIGHKMAVLEHRLKRHPKVAKVIDDITEILYLVIQKQKGALTNSEAINAACTQAFNHKAVQVAIGSVKKIATDAAMKTAGLYTNPNFVPAFVTSVSDITPERSQEAAKRQARAIVNSMFKREDQPAEEAFIPSPVAPADTQDHATQRKAAIKKWVAQTLGIIPKDPTAPAQTDGILNNKGLNDAISSTKESIFGGMAAALATAAKVPLPEAGTAQTGKEKITDVATQILFRRIAGPLGISFEPTTTVTGAHLARKTAFKAAGVFGQVGNHYGCAR